MDYKEKLVFVADWYDYDCSHLKHFYLHYYPFDNTVELHDQDRNRIYLRRAICEGLSVKDMFVGNTVRIYGRQIRIIDYADLNTRKKIGKKTERTFALLKPTVLKHLGPILMFIYEKKFQIMKLKLCRLSHAEALTFYEEKKTDASLPFLADHLISGPIIAMELVGEDAVKRWKEFMGPEEPALARKEAPDSLRALYGKELISNGFHGADSDEAAVIETDFFFPKPNAKHPAPPSFVQLKHSTCCVIKPHAIKSGNLGKIITDILQQFQITGMEMFYLSNSNANEFLEVYRNVISDFNALMLSFVDGPCIALEITALREDCDVQDDFRKASGPYDPDIARQIRPNTLRAKYGVDKYKNAVHCTDLAEDGILELEYFFRILQD